MSLFDVKELILSISSSFVVANEPADDKSIRDNYSLSGFLNKLNDLCTLLSCWLFLTVRILIKLIM